MNIWVALTSGKFGTFPASHIADFIIWKPVTCWDFTISPSNNELGIEVIWYFIDRSHLKSKWSGHSVTECFANCCYIRIFCAQFIKQFRKAAYALQLHNFICRGICTQARVFVLIVMPARIVNSFCTITAFEVSNVNSSVWIDFWFVCYLRCNKA